MKFKYYLRGLGLGILFTTLVLTISFSLHKDEISDDEIIARAKKLGMVMKEDEPLVFPQESQMLSDTQEEIEQSEVLDFDNTEVPDDNLVVPEDEQTQSESEQSETPDDEGTNLDIKDEEVEKPNPEEDEEPSGDSDEREYVGITINKGEVCRTVADKLAKEGLVYDAEEFRDFMKERQYDNFIQVGYFSIPRDASFEEIAQILITK